MIAYSIIQKSQLEGADRLDAEYYQPEYLSVIQKISRCQNIVLLQKISTIKTGPAYSSEEMGDTLDYPLARIGDVVAKTEFDSWFSISKKEFQKFGERRINDLDILMTMTGDPPDVGKCNIIRVTKGEILAFNQRVAKLTPKINPYYLFAYLSTNTARLQSERNALGIRQRNLGIEDLRDTVVALFPLEKVSQIESLIKDYLGELEESSFVFTSRKFAFGGVGIKRF